MRYFMSKRLNKLALTLIAAPLLFSCTNATNDTTGTKRAEVVGFDTNIYLDIDGNYNQIRLCLVMNHIYTMSRKQIVIILL